MRQQSAGCHWFVLQIQRPSFKMRDRAVEKAFSMLKTHRLIDRVRSSVELALHPSFGQNPLQQLRRE